MTKNRGQLLDSNDDDDDDDIVKYQLKNHMKVSFLLFQLLVGKKPLIKMDYQMKMIY